MKSESLFGVQFSTTEKYRKFLAKNYTAWLTKQALDQQRRMEERLISLGTFLGITREEAEKLVRKYEPVKLQIPAQPDVMSLLEEVNCEHYYVTQTVMELCQKIRVKEPFDLEWLAPIPDGKRQLNFGSKFVRYNKVGTKIHAFAASNAPADRGSDPMRYTFFNMDLSAKEISHPEMEDFYSGAEKERYLDFDAAARKQFFQLVTFIELGEIQEILVAPKSKHGTKKSALNLLNQESFPLRIINTNWNKTIRTEGFGVDWHWRLQPWGPNFSKRKLLLIHPFQKKGYNLKARKLDDRNKGQRP